MGGQNSWKQGTAVVVIFALLCLFLPTSPAVAGWIPTRAATEGAKARILSLLERNEIAAGLQEMGVSLTEAKRRLWVRAGIQIADGNHYSAAVYRHLGRPEGICRASFAHYDNAATADGFLDALAGLEKD